MFSSRRRKKKKGLFWRQNCSNARRTTSMDSTKMKRSDAHQSIRRYERQTTQPGEDVYRPELHSSLGGRRRTKAKNKGPQQDGSTGSWPISNSVSSSLFQLHELPLAHLSESNSFYIYHSIGIIHCNTNTSSSKEEKCSSSLQCFGDEEIKLASVSSSPSSFSLPPSLLSLPLLSIPSLLLSSTYFCTF
jgi:hypothetical protein